MKKILVIYWTHDGHTARVARRICETIEAEGHKAVMMEVVEAEREGVDFDEFDVVALGCGLRYGKFDKEFCKFTVKNKAVLDAKPNSMFNLTAIARNKAKAVVSGNVYARKFLENNPWKPREMKCFGGKVDYPNYGPIDSFCIRLIMSMTNGPTDKHSVTDFTDWNDVAGYARHLIELAG